jgi:hypothetical protein
MDNIYIKYYIKKIKEDYRNIKYVPDKYLSKKIIKIALNENSNSLNYIDDNKKTYNICLKMMIKDGWFYDYLDYSNIPILPETFLLSIPKNFISFAFLSKIFHKTHDGCVNTFLDINSNNQKNISYFYF